MHRIPRSHAFMSIATAVAFVVIMVVVVVVTLKIAGGSSSTIQLAPLPQSAASVAQQARCSDFTDTGAAEAGGSIDTGTCYIGTVKYGVNVFGSKANRDRWIDLAEQLGAKAPTWESDTAVVYVATNQSS